MAKELWTLVAQVPPGWHQLANALVHLVRLDNVLDLVSDLGSKPGKLIHAIGH